MTRPRIRCLFRISLRTMLLVMAVLCVLLGLKARQVKKQQAAVALVRKAGGSVTYAYQVDEEAEDIDYDANPPGPDWLCDWVGVEYFTTVHTVQLADANDLSPLAQLTDAKIVNLPRLQAKDLSGLKPLTELEGLVIDGVNVDNLSPLAAMIHLRGLYLFSGWHVSEISAVENMSDLQVLSVEGSQVADLSPLTNLTELVELNLANTQVRDLSPLRRLGKLKVLDVSGTPVSDLSPLATLGKLEGLVLRHTKVEDLSPLVELNRLKVLRLFQSRVTDQEAAKLQEMLPNCRIDRRL